jgi:uncharacterized protein (DUF1330 family)
VSDADKRDQIERLRPEGFASFAERAGDGPIVMLNLLAFEPEGGEQRYGEYAAATAPMLARVGARLLAAYRPAPTLIGDDDWDLVALVEYPTCGAFLEMIGSEDYQAITHMRTESLRRAALVPMDPSDDALTVAHADG